jgi:N-formylmaleamate deformylase
VSAIEIRGRSEHVAANGLRHRILSYGDSHDRDLLLLPGITSPAVTADFVAVHLADMGYRVVVPDARGRGETDRAQPGGYRLTDYAADVAALVDVLGLRDPVIVGHSMGARTAAAYAVLHAARRHGLLVLVDPPLSGPGRGPYPTPRESFVQQLREAQRGTDADEVRRFYPLWPQRELQLRAQVLASCDETAVLESHSSFEQEDFFTYWTQLSHPVVLVRGGDSPVVSDAGAADLRAARPDIEIRTVAGAGHMVPWDDLAGFLATVRPLLLDNPTRSPA